MKIKMTSSVAKFKDKTYNHSYIFEAGKDIDKDFAQRLVDVNFCKVLNTAPTIHGVSNKSVDYSVAFDKMAGVTATDHEEGDLTSKIVVVGNVNVNTPGQYNLTYTVSDNDGLTDEKKCVITVDEMPPLPPEPVEPEPVTERSKATISGANNVTIENGSTFWLKTGVTATDDVDGNLTDSIKITGTVNTKNAGVQKVTYSITNSAGMTTTKNRNVTVKEAIQEDIDEVQ